MSLATSAPKIFTDHLESFQEEFPGFSEDALIGSRPDFILDKGDMQMKE